MCNDLIQRGVSPVGILRMLSGHVMKLTKIHAGKKVAGHPFFVDKLKKQARVFEEKRVVAAISGIAEADRGIRQSKIKDSFLLENLIREICR